jgi:alkyl hydroperoxide reductase subunit AhpF
LPALRRPLFKGKRTAVIGGGNSGIEAAIDLAGIVKHVTVIEFADQLKADAVLVSKLKSLPNVTVHTNAQTTEITGADGKVNGIRYKDRTTGDDHWVELEGVFVQIGLVPNTEFLKGTVGAEQVWRDRGGRQGPHQCARRVCSRRLHHRALQADRHCRRRGCQSRPERL